MAVVWNDGCGKMVLQPEPVPSPLPLFHTTSDQPRALESLVSEVPPTAVTASAVAGKEAPVSLSPALAVTRTPAWV